MGISAKYAGPEHTTVAFTVDGVTRYVPADWRGEFRMEHVDGGGVVGLLARGGSVSPYAAPPLTIDEVKAEAHRRIVAVMPEHKQRNLTALALETMQEHGTNPALWPAGLKAINDVAKAKWGQIKDLRTKSDEIEAMNPIPNDFTDDSYWA